MTIGDKVSTFKELLYYLMKANMALYWNKDNGQAGLGEIQEDFYSIYQLISFWWVPIGKEWDTLDQITKKPAD